MEFNKEQKMKRKAIASASAVFVVSCVLFAKSIEKKSAEEALPGISRSNIEALTQSEGQYFKVEKREDKRCSINVGAKGQIRLLGGTILTAGAEGVVSFDGQVVCIGSGDVYCKPVECVDLYRVVLPGQK